MTSNELALGLVPLQPLLTRLQSNDRLLAALSPSGSDAIFGSSVVALVLIDHLLPGTANCGSFATVAMIRWYVLYWSGLCSGGP